MMKRVVINLADGTKINLPATKIELQEGVVIAFDGDEIVGIVHPSVLNAVWISEKKEP